MKNKNEVAIIERNNLFEKLHLPINGRLSKSDCIRLNAALFNYDKETREQIISVIPNWFEVQKNVSSDYKDITEDILDKNEASENQYYQAGKSIIDSCNARINDPNTSDEERIRCENDRKLVFCEMGKKDTEKKEFNNGIHNNTVNFLGAIAFGFLLLIGVKMIDSESNA